MVVVEAIEYQAPLPPPSNQPHLAQPPELMRDCGLAHLELPRQHAHAQLLLEQHRYDTHAAGIAEGAEQIRQLDRFQFRQVPGFHEYLNKCSYDTPAACTCQREGAGLDATHPAGKGGAEELPV